MRKLKITIIGSGSSYMPELLEGIINNRVFEVSEIALVDVPSGMKKAETILALTKRMLKKVGNSAKLSLTTDRREALYGADFVVTQFRIGGLDARIKDEKIPLSYGLVGQETTGPGGFANALRTVPVAVAIAKEMEELCPTAYLINFANPSGIVTESLHRHSKIKSVGLCNLPINVEREFAQYYNLDSSQVYVKMAGLNHLSFVTDIIVNGASKFNELFESGYFTKRLSNETIELEKAEDLINSIRLMPTSYLQYFWFEKEKIEAFKKEVEAGLGTRGEKVKLVEDDLFKMYADVNLDHKPKELEKRGGALYSTAALNLIVALNNTTPSMQIVNTLNRGAIPNLPYDCVVETNSHISIHGVNAISAEPLPETVAPLVNTIKQYEILTVEAAMTGDRNIAYQALLTHPLVHGHKNAKNLLDDFLLAHKDYLPNFYQYSELT